MLGNKIYLEALSRVGSKRKGKTNVQCIRGPVKIIMIIMIITNIDGLRILGRKERKKRMNKVLKVLSCFISS